MATKTYLSSILLLVLLTASIYFIFDDSVRIDIGKTSTTFKVFEDGKWVLAGVEYVNVFDGVAKMRAKSRSLITLTNGDITTVTRQANYKENISTIEIYTFDSSVTDIRLVPINHSIRVLNADDKILQYEVRKLLYEGTTVRDVPSPQSFGHNMKVEWDDGNYYSRIYKYFWYPEGKLTVRYRIKSNDYSKNVRLFDPPEDVNVTAEHPADNFVSPVNNITFSCFFNMTDGDSPKNVSLWTNNSGTFSLVNNTNFLSVYDPINDSSVNTSLWSNTSSSTGDTTNSVWLSENSSSLRQRQVSNGLGSVNSITMNFTAYSLKDYMVYGNVTFKAEISAYSTGSFSNDATSTITVFGNDIKSITRVTSGTTSDNSVWNIINNGTEGYFNVTDDDVYTETILAVDNNITFSGLAHSNLLQGIAEQKVFYVNVTYIPYKTENFTYTIDDTTLWGCSACNSLDVCNVSYNRTLFLDDVSPVVSIIYPTNVSFITNVSQINYSVTDAYGSRCWYEKSDVNSSDVSFGTNFTNVISGIGANEISVFCNDTSSNIGFGKVNYGLRILEFNDTSDPTDKDALFISKDWVYVLVNINPVFEHDVVSIILYEEGGTTNNQTFYDATKTYNFTGLSAGVFRWNVTSCNATTCESTATRIYANETIGLLLNGTYNSIDKVELGANVSVNATSDVDYVYLDIDAPEYGMNSDSGFLSVQIDMVINYFRNKLFTNGVFSQMINYSSAGYQQISIPAHQYDEVEGFFFNLSGVTEGSYPTNVWINNSNTTIIDRYFPGELMGNTIYQNKLNDGSLTSTLDFPTLGPQTKEFFMDDGGTLKVLTFKVAGLLYGTSFRDDYHNTTFVNVVDSSAMVRGGFILPKGENLTSFVYDTFTPNGDYSSVLWSGSADGTFGGGGNDYTWTRDNSYSGGGLNLYTTMDENFGVGNQGTRTVTSTTLANYTIINIWSSEEVDVVLEHDSSADRDESLRTCDITQNAYLGNVLFWSSPWELCDNEPGNCEIYASTIEPLDFHLQRRINNSWNVTVTGVEETHGTQQDPCGTYTFTYNYTNGSLIKDYQLCTDVYEELPNYYVIEDLDTATQLQLYFTQVLDGSYKESDTAGCTNMVASLNVTLVNNSLFNYTNSTLDSNSVFDSSGDITAATFYDGYTNYHSNPQTQTVSLSADDGNNWESVAEGVELTFTFSGKNLKYRWAFGLVEGFTTNPPFVTFFNITTAKGYPSNVSFDFGDDGVIDDSFPGILNDTNSPITITITDADLTDSFTSQTSFPHLYDMPLSISTDSVGTLELTNFNFTYDPNPISLNSTSILSYLINSFNFTNFFIDIFSNSGNITVDDLRYDYAGGNKTVTVLAHNEEYTKNNSLNITYYYSRWDYEFLPVDVEWVYFAPTSPTALNVTPYGQTLTVPLMNITNYGYGGVDAILSIMQDDTNPCVNTTLSITGDKSDGFLINDSFIDIKTMGYLETINISLWADYDCSYSTWNLFEPQYYFRQCVEGGVCTTEII